MANYDFSRKMVIPPTILGIILILAFILVTCLVFESPAKTRNFNDADLLIDQDDMPAGWKLRERSEKINDSEGQKSGARIKFRIESYSYPFLMEIVYRFHSEDQASFKYLQFKKIYIDPYSSQIGDEYERIWFDSKTVDEWSVGCERIEFTAPHPSEYKIICSFFARYDEFVIFSNVDVERDGQVSMDREAWNSVINAMNQKFDALLNQ